MKLKKYVAFDEHSFEFMGFYTEGRKDLPESIAEINSQTFMEDKGQHTHYNPDSGWYSIQAEIDAALLLANRAWRDNQLKNTDVYLVSDFPISNEDREEVKLYRQSLRDYPNSWIKPNAPTCLQ